MQPKLLRSGYLFDSYAKLVHNEKSDIDIAIVIEKGKNAEAAKKAARKAEARYGKAIELHFFEKKDLKGKDSLISEIKRNNAEFFDKIN
ncbi:nucleotidyltransferase domain-containing protein [Candidatus Woesearchaeota archaeon]|nr:nucleotidyltransferase domain-containing protein [Candidatus Woesearchaeota archaeon]